MNSSNKLFYSFLTIRREKIGRTPAGIFFEKLVLPLGITYFFQSRRGVEGATWSKKIKTTKNVFFDGFFCNILKKN